MGSVLSVTEVDGNVIWGLKSVGVFHGECAVRDCSRWKCYMGTEVIGSATWGVCVLPVTEIDECVTRGVCCL